MAALEKANRGHVVAYGHDSYTKQAEAAFRGVFGPQADVLLAFSGAATNVMALRALTKPYEGIICAETSHLHTDECGAIEAVGSRKLLLAPSHDGKLWVEDLQRFAAIDPDVHHVQPKVLSITQSTEYGTVYSLQEVKALAEFAHKQGWWVHLDGARIANAAVAQGVSLAEATQAVGVDILSFGGTKNGLMFGEAIVLLNPELAQQGYARDLRYLRMQTLQLASKMRYLAAQFVPYLEAGLWQENAQQANQMAQYLAEQVADIPGVVLTRPVEANAVFATIPRRCIAPLQQEAFFYVWDAAQDEVRWMCSFDTTQADVDRFVALLKRHVGQMVTG